MECSLFWCANMKCSSYHTGEKCADCKLNNQCKECILQNKGNKPDSCERIRAGIMEGRWGNEEE